VVSVNEAPAQPTRQNRANSGLAGTHKANQNNP
jgi:hypothetical protein